MSFEEFNKPKSGYMAYVLTDQSRNELLRHFTPKNSEVICHHVTWKQGAKDNDPLPPEVHEAHVIGYAEEDGLETLAVELNGNTKQPDGRPLHITLSLDRGKGKKPVHAGELLKQDGFKPIPHFAIHLEPKFLLPTSR